MQALYLVAGLGNYGMYVFFLNEKTWLLQILNIWSLRHWTGYFLLYDLQFFYLRVGYQNIVMEICISYNLILQKIFVKMSWLKFWGYKKGKNALLPNSNSDLLLKKVTCFIPLNKNFFFSSSCQILHYKYPSFFWMSKVVEVFIMISITVSFMAFGIAMHHLSK